MHQVLKAATFAALLTLPLAAANAARAACPTPSGISRPAWVVANFDHDRNPDLAVVNIPNRRGQTSGQEVSINFGPLEPGALSLCDAVPTERLRALDLDGDSDKDLVLETLSAVPIAVWLNDGDGHFHAGNLGDYSFLLSHRDPFSFDVRAAITAQEDSDECPRSQLDAAVSSIHVATCVSTRVRAADPCVVVRFLSASRTRGPPLHS